MDWGLGYEFSQPCLKQTHSAKYSQSGAEPIATFNDDNVNIDAIAGKISMDPVLTAKVLRLGNPPTTGFHVPSAPPTMPPVLLGFPPCAP